MRGPDIIANTLSVATPRGKSATAWQYHSRSDHHSKVACWGIIFDLMRKCRPFRDAVQKGQVGFRINHVMVSQINKALDLVVTTDPPRSKGTRRTFSDLVKVYGIVLTSQDQADLTSLPVLEEDLRDDVAEVAIALEAKACMTEHIKAKPRLFSEILAAGYVSKLAASGCITVSHTLVNGAASFKTATKTSFKINPHTQPHDAQSVVDMLSAALPQCTASYPFGFDAVGVNVIDCANDGTPVTVRTSGPAPTPKQHVYYNRMVLKICHEFRKRFVGTP